MPELEFADNVTSMRTGMDKHHKVGTLRRLIKGKDHAGKDMVQALFHVVEYCMGTDGDPYE